MLRLTLLILLLTLTRTKSAFADENDKEYRQALDVSREAIYIQLDVKKYIDNVNTIVKNKLPKEMRETMDLVLPIMDVVVKKRIEVKYEF